MFNMFKLICLICLIYLCFILNKIMNSTKLNENNLDSMRSVSQINQKVSDEHSVLNINNYNCDGNYVLIIT